MVKTVHVVKGRQHIVHIGCPQSQKWSVRPTLDLNLNTTITEMSLIASAVQLPKFRSVGSWMACCQASYRDYVRQEVQPAILARESNMQLIIYSLNMCVRYSMYLLPIFKSQKGSIEALNFLMKLPHRLPNNCTIIIS